MTSIKKIFAYIFTLSFLFLSSFSLTASSYSSQDEDNYLAEVSKNLYVDIDIKEAIQSLNYFSVIDEYSITVNRTSDDGSVFDVGGAFIISTILR